MQRWYVIECQENRLILVWGTLICSGFNAWAPIDRVKSTVRRRNWDGTEKVSFRETKKPRFGNYIFLQADDDAIANGPTVSFVRAIRGAHDFLTGAGSERPAPMPEGLVEFYKDFRPLTDRDNAKRFKRGQKVRLIDGPFKGHEGRIESVDSCGTLRLLLDLFGRLTPIIIEVGHVEARAPCIELHPKGSTSERRAAH